MFNLKSFSPILVFVFCVSCSKSENYENATLESNNNKHFIKLKGKRERITHDFWSLLFPKTCEDSILLPVPFFKDGIIYGKDIPVQKGYYDYQGEIIIDKNNIKVNLVFDDTSIKKKRPLSWNGNYRLK